MIGCEATLTRIALPCFALLCPCKKLQEEVIISLHDSVCCAARHVLSATWQSHRCLQDSGLRRGKILAAAEQYAQSIAAAVDALVAQSGGNKATLRQTIAEPVTRQVPLPASIVANHEPFRHGDWRKEPYTVRYNVLGCFPDLQLLMHWPQ